MKAVLQRAPDLSRLARRAAKRHTRQLVLEGAARALLIALPLAVVVLIGTLLALTGLDLGRAAFEALATLGAAVAALAVLPALSVAVHRAYAARGDRAQAVWRMDRSLRLKGQLGGGFSLLEADQRGGFCDLAVQRAEEQAKRIDLRRTLPTPPLEVVLVPLLLGAATLVWSLVSAEPPRERASRALVADQPTPESRAAARDLRRSARTLRERSQLLDAESAQEAERLADVMDHAGRRLERSGGSPRVTRSVLARVAGQLSSAHAGGGEALREAGAALAEAPLGRDLGRTLANQDRGEEVQRAADELARSLDDSSLAERERLAEAAEAAADHLAEKPDEERLREALSKLAEALRQEGGQPAAAAAQVGREGARRTNAVRLGGLVSSARAEVDRAWREPGSSESAPGQAGQTPETSGGDSSGSPRGAKGRPSPTSRKPSPPEGDRQPQEGMTTANDPRQGRPRGGGKRSAAVSSGEAARGPSGRAGPPGTGSGDGQGDSSPEDRERSTRREQLRGLVGRRGAAVLVAVDDVGRDRPTPTSRRILTEYGRVEEEALRGSAVPLDRRELVKRYLEAIRSQ